MRSQSNQLKCCHLEIFNIIQSQLQYLIWFKHLSHYKVPLNMRIKSLLSQKEELLDENKREEVMIPKVLASFQKHLAGQSETNLHRQWNQMNT